MPLHSPAPHALGDLQKLLAYDDATGTFTRRRNGRIVGRVDRTGRVQISAYCRMYYAHRLAWYFAKGTWPTGTIDHIDGNPLNNRISNLREATISQQVANQRRRTKHGVGLKGVSYHKQARKFQASIKVDWRSIYLGLFGTPEAAHGAYLIAAQKHFGQFARAA